MKMNNMFKLLKLYLLHPSATLYIRCMHRNVDKVYYKPKYIWYCKAANEIIIETDY